MFKKERGITLVALVVTIVVLLILADVSISMVLGNNGIVNKAKSTQVEQDKAYGKEVIESALKSVQIDILSGKKTTNATAADVVKAIYNLDYTAEIPAKNEFQPSTDGNSITYTKGRKKFTYPISVGDSTADFVVGTNITEADV